MNSKPLPEGFRCSKCGVWHKFPPYVYAHFDEHLIHTCACGAKHDIRSGVATEDKDVDKS